MFDFLFDEELFCDSNDDLLIGEEFEYEDYVFGNGTICSNGEIRFADGTTIYV